jgi:hypothetical protein
MNKHVEFPEFELVGPKCINPDCWGVLVDTMDLKTKEFYFRCSVCEQKFARFIEENDDVHN